MTHFDWSNVRDREAALARPASRDDAVLLGAVRAIVEDVRDLGWAALVGHSERIDGLGPQRLDVAPFARVGRQRLSESEQDAIRLAARNIETFHHQTMPADVEVSPMDGLRVGKLWRPIRRVGLYIPGGRAPLFSTLMMLAIPARVAGVEDIVVMTPPRKDGGLDPTIAYAAEMCGIETIWAVGGAQAIAALAFGAGAIPKVDRICGPGNAWVAAAKALVSSAPGGPGIDLPAGPSELMIIADATADPVTVAADMLSQAEHDPDAQVLLVSPAATLLDRAASEFRRQSTAMGANVAPARFIQCADLVEAVGIANQYAPEHLALACQDADQRVADVQNAGAVFVGNHAAESFGDYLAGSSHVLPTDGAARYCGGVSTLTFMKSITVQHITEGAARMLATPAAALARLEGLEAHARAAEARQGTVPA